MRFTILAAVLAACLVMMTVASAEPNWRDRWRTARFRTLESPDASFSERENRLTLDAAMRIFDIAGSTSRARCIAERESGWNEYAYNASSGAAGIFQHLLRYWPGRVAAYNAASRLDVGRSVFNARANILVSARLMALGQWFHWASTDCGGR